MPSGSTFLNSKVARRVFTLFIVCAFVPITILAAFTLRQVSGHLRSTASQRLRLASRAHGQGIAERLSLLETELLLATQTWEKTDPERVAEPSSVPTTLGDGHLTSLAQLDGERSVALWGSVDEPPMLSPDERDHLGRGRTVLAMRPRPVGLPLIRMLRAVDAAAPGGALWIASIDPLFVLAGGSDTLPPNTEMCVLDHLSAPVFCTTPSDRSLPEVVLAGVAAESTGTFEWTHASGTYVAGHWSVPLAFRFHVARWTVVLSEARESVVAPVARFQQAFPLVVLALLCASFLLSVSEIRRILVPLEKLRDGTTRIGARNFDSRVEVASGDEFQELADSFNGMAGRLGKQFNALSTLAEVDRAILSTLDLEAIVNTVLRELPVLISCDAVNITIASRIGEGVPRSYSLEAGSESDAVVETVGFDDDEARELLGNPETLTIEPPDPVPAHLDVLARLGCNRYFVLPLVVDGRPAGAIALGHVGPIRHEDDDLLRARQLSDQVAIALSNVRLLEDLDDLNWGTLTALARTVDAKSAWTAGHSERVTRMALKIGREMNLSEHDLGVLHRGGLLHDIGKIAVPMAIIDNPAPLSAEEFAVIKTHPDVGADILAPIGAYADAIPIVRQHHERWDGGGYPCGLAGEKIDRLARILCVADCYDAVVSDRPYRPGRSAGDAIRTIVEVTGTQLDPSVVEAFLNMVEAAGHRRPTRESRLREPQAVEAGVESSG